METKYFCFKLNIILTIVILFHACAEEKTGHLWNKESSLYEISKEVIIERPLDPENPQPSGIWGGNSPNLSTPAMKLSLWGPPEKITLSISKTDVWDRRKGWEKPVTLEEIRRGAFSVANKDDQAIPGWDDKQREIMHPEGGFWHPYESWEAYSFPCAKPVGQVIISSDDFQSMEQQMTGKTHCNNGLTTVSLQNGHAEGTIEYLPMMDEPMIAVRADFTGLASPVSVRLFRHRDIFRDGIFTPKIFDSQWRIDDYDYEKDSEWNGPLDPPEAGKEGPYFWIRQEMPAEKTFPEGFEYYLVGKIIDNDVKIETVEGEYNLGTLPGKGLDYGLRRKAPGAASTAYLPEKKNLKFTILITIVTSNDGLDSNLIKIAKQRLESAEEKGMNLLISDNSEWYKSHYDRREHGRIYTGFNEDVKKQIPNIFKNWSCTHTCNTMPDPTKYEADAGSYSLLEFDGSPWHGLPCYNELYFTHEAVINRSDRFDYYINLVNFWLDAARDNAREVYDKPGMCLIHGYIPPIKPDKYPHTTASFELAMCTPAMVLKLLWDTWDYGGDENFLCNKVYPALKDLAVFYSAYVQKQDDGYYHVRPTIAQERWGITYKYEYNTDATASLAMIKWTLNRAAEATEILNVDSDLRSRWLSIANNIAPYPTVSSSYGVVLTAVPGDTSMNSRHNGRLAPANLSDEINLDSDSEEIELAVRTAKRFISERDAGRVFHLLGQNYEIAYPRLVGSVGYLDSLKYHNACINAYWNEPERLLNSRSGRIHLFPCVVENATVAFRDFQARDGFLVSAECQKGKVTYFNIKSRRNVNCRIATTWLEDPYNKVKVFRERDSSIVRVNIDKEYNNGIVFRAEKDESYIIKESE